MIIKDVSKTYGKIGRAQKMFNFLKLNWDALYLTVFIYYCLFQNERPGVIKL